MELELFIEETEDGQYSWTLYLAENEPQFLEGGEEPTVKECEKQARLWAAVYLPGSRVVRKIEEANLELPVSL
jgi:hypothetical protein